MINIDDKDKKILYELDQDSRQSISEIGKKIGIHENVVSYRIKNLEKKGIIQYYYTVIDTLKLGFISVRFYLRLQFVTPKITKEILEYFLKNKYAWCVASLEGKYHIAVNVLVKNLNDFSLHPIEPHPTNKINTLLMLKYYYKITIFCNKL